MLLLLLSFSLGVVAKRLTRGGLLGSPPASPGSSGSAPKRQKLAKGHKHPPEGETGSIEFPVDVRRASAMMVNKVCDDHDIVVDGNRLTYMRLTRFLGDKAAMTFINQIACVCADGKQLKESLDSYRKTLDVLDANFQVAATQISKLSSLTEEVAHRVQEWRDDDVFKQFVEVLNSKEEFESLPPSAAEVESLTPPTAEVAEQSVASASAQQAATMKGSAGKGGAAEGDADDDDDGFMTQQD